jgi:hypothetical protein
LKVVRVFEFFNTIKIFVFGVIIIIIIIIHVPLHLNRPRPYRYSSMSSSNLAIHITQSFGINNIHKLAYVWTKYNYS